MVNVGVPASPVREIVARVPVADELHLPRLRPDILVDACERALPRLVDRRVLPAEKGSLIAAVTFEGRQAD